MKPKLTVYTKHTNNINATKIEFIEFNFDGRGEALVRYDNDKFVSIMERDDVYSVFTWDAPNGDRFEIVTTDN